MVGFLTCAVAAPANGAAPKARTLAVGEVSAKEAGEDVRTEARLRELLTREVERLRLATPPRDEAYVISMSLVSMRASVSADESRASCTVSATLRRESDGAMLAILRGRGAAEGARGALADTKDGALEGAVRAAVRRVPEAF